MLLVLDRPSPLPAGTRSTVTLAAAITAVRATAVLRRGLIYLLNRLALRCWRLFATFSTSNRRHAASYQGMDCKSHRGAETWSHLPLNRLALRCRRRLPPS